MERDHRPSETHHDHAGEHDTPAHTPRKRTAPSAGARKPAATAGVTQRGHRDDSYRADLHLDISNRHDHRERVGGDDEHHESIQAHDLKSRVTAIQALDEGTEITMAGGWKHGVYVGTEGHLLEADGDILCEFTITKVTENRAKAVIPFRPSALEGASQIVIAPSQRRPKAKLKRETEARITMHMIEGDSLLLGVGIGTDHGVHPGETRGYIVRENGRRFEFAVTRPHRLPTRTYVLVPRAGTGGSDGFVVDELKGARVFFLP